MSELYKRFPYMRGDEEFVVYGSSDRRRGIITKFDSTFVYTHSKGFHSATYVMPVVREDGDATSPCTCVWLYRRVSR